MLHAYLVCLSPLHNNIYVVHVAKGEVRFTMGLSLPSVYLLGVHYMSLPCK